MYSGPPLKRIIDGLRKLSTRRSAQSFTPARHYVENEALNNASSSFHISATFAVSERTSHSTEIQIFTHFYGQYKL